MDVKNIDGVENVLADHNTEKVIVTSNNEILESIIKEKIEDIEFEVVKED